MIPARVQQLVLATAVSAVSLASGVSEARLELERFATNSGKSFAQVMPEAGIPRFAQIRPGLARGGRPGEEGVQYLRDRGYRTIVSFLTDAAESVWVVQSGMRYVHIPIRSSFFSAQLPTENQVRQFLSVVSDSSLYPMFIHCKAGKDRTGAMSAIYRMEVCGWTADEAVEEMNAFGFAGRYGKLRRFVQGYPAPAASSLASVTSSLPADSTVVESKQASPASED
jgi:protein tyrosine phosphatase (PTP) superfamily phosphohydrolase (DUF442 family)